MASDNKTVADITEVMRGMKYPISRSPDLRMIAYADRIDAANKRELDRCAIIAGASLADSVEEKYKREIEALREALDCVASRLRVFSRDNLNALQCRLIGRMLFVAEDALGKLGGRPRKIRPSNP